MELDKCILIEGCHGCQGDTHFWQDWHSMARLAPDGKTGTRCQDWHPMTRETKMNPTLADLLVNARIYDLEQPRFAGMPIHPVHRPGYFYALHRRHKDGYRPDTEGPRTGASGVVTMMEHSGTHIHALCHHAR